MKTQNQRQLIRKIENILFFLFKKRNWQYLLNYKKNYRFLNDIIKNAGTKNIIVSYSMPFNCALFQRPQQLAIELSKCGFLYLYAEQKNVLSYKYNDSLVISHFDLIQKVCKKNGVKPYILVTSTSPYSLKQILKLKEQGFKIIYEYIDEMSEEIHDTVEGLKIFKNLDKISPVFCIATSQKLYNQLAQIFPEEKLLLNKNAVKIEDFDQNPDFLSQDIQSVVDLGKPIVGYYGAIATWLNYDLLNRLSKERPQYNFVFIGSDFKGLSKLELRDNVFYLGEKQYKDLYKYSKQFNCAIIPFKEGEIAKATSPVKLFEYMAVKKPVVGTKDLLECYGYDGVFIAQNDDDFINLVDKAVESASHQDIQNSLFEYAKQNTWKNRAESIMEKINELSE